MTSQLMLTEVLRLRSRAPVAYGYLLVKLCGLISWTLQEIRHSQLPRVGRLIDCFAEHRCLARWVPSYIYTYFMRLLGIYKGFDRAYLNPSNAEANFVQSNKSQDFTKTIYTLPCWYSLERFCRVLSDEYTCARVSVTSQLFMHHFVLVKLATCSKRGNTACTMCQGSRYLSRFLHSTT